MTQRETAYERVARVMCEQLGDPARYNTLLIGMQTRFSTEAKLEAFLPELKEMWAQLTGHEMSPDVWQQLSGRAQ